MKLHAVNDNTAAVLCHYFPVTLAQSKNNAFTMLYLNPLRQVFIK